MANRHYFWWTSWNFLKKIMYLFIALFLDLYSNVKSREIEIRYLDLKLFFGFFVSIWFRINWKMVSSVVVVIVVGLDVGFLRRFLGLLLFDVSKFDFWDWITISSFFRDWKTSSTIWRVLRLCFFFIFFNNRKGKI